MATAKVKVATYLEDDDHEKLKALAKAEKRSVSSQLSKIINDYFSRNTEDSGDASKKAVEFLKKLTASKRPSTEEQIILAHTLDVPVERLEEIVLCILDRLTIKSGNSS